MSSLFEARPVSIAGSFNLEADAWYDLRLSKCLKHLIASSSHHMGRAEASIATSARCASKATTIIAPGWGNALVRRTSAPSTPSSLRLALLIRALKGLSSLRWPSLPWPLSCSALSWRQHTSCERKGRLSRPLHSLVHVAGLLPQVAEARTGQLGGRAGHSGQRAAGGRWRFSFPRL